MKKLLLFLAVSGTIAAHAQVFWTEDFGTGCNRGQLASAYTGTNGAWTITATGTNDTYYNPWFVSATAAGTTVNNCADNCLFSSTTNQSLHIGNPSFTAFSTYVGADTGSTYLTGVFCGIGICSQTNNRAESPTINCTNRAGITVTFLYYENGENTNDDATFWYYNGSTWAQIDAIAKTTTTCPVPSGTWTQLTVNLPSSANNNPNVKIGFNWTNNGSGGADPSFAVDDITLNSTATYVPPVQPYSTDIQVYAAGHNIIVDSRDAYKVLAVIDILGRSVPFTLSGNTINMKENKEGVYFVQVEVKGIKLTRKVLIH
ncbi:MAG: T9SS type A sorting domain-containing protein [Bacteroidota bacterium]